VKIRENTLVETSADHANGPRPRLVSASLFCPLYHIMVCSGVLRKKEIPPKHEQDNFDL